MLNGFLRLTNLSCSSKHICKNAIYRNLVTQAKALTIRNKIVNEAEKIVGYPTSFLSLRWLLNDEIANIISHIKRLIGTNHPLLASARGLLLGNEIPTWGLIVLLISKAGGLPKDVSEIDKDIMAGILHSQRVLAEVTEMIHTSNILHNSILNISQNNPQYSDLNFGNTLSLLSGDFLLSSSFKELAGLKNQEVNELVSACLRDLTEAAFIEPRDEQNRALPAKPLKMQTDIVIPNEFGTKPLKIKDVLGNAKAEWTLRHFLGTASLLAKCCQGALKLAGHSDNFQKLGYIFGKNMALAWKANEDLEAFQLNKDGIFDLVAAPVLFHLQHDPAFYDEILKGSQNIEDCDYKKMREMIHCGPALKLTQDLKQELVENSIEVLQQFSDSDARSALINIVKVW
ncbi:all trans-polyprenyl-diphosphate synthase PDSS2-like [Cylas formicarius]|uniref:all trans-polyprenyl-diphosphate synthase PDSS2-like n=1 Tax=Cylas formicarius TaxID=197179 RepID=UPI0029588B38|nr:all trans-polyprenyl-diphosphate synthase PDSS2-like [Cylas formicarius]